jgi:hypothetical protein
MFLTVVTLNMTIILDTVHYLQFLKHVSCMEGKVSTQYDK